MATPIEAPKLGNTVEECIVSQWRKHKGDAVKAGEVILDLETDKATFEVPSPVDGTVLELFFEEGALVPVFTNVCVIGEPGESVEAFRPAAAGKTESVGSAEPTSQATAAAAVNAPVEIPQTTAASGVMSPRARRWAQDHHFHPPAVSGSGPGGRVMEEDLRRAYYSAPSLTRAKAQVPPVPAPATVPSVVPGAGAAAAQRPARGGSRLRDTIGRRMKESLATTAQYTLHSSADAAGLLRLRARVKADPSLPAININDLVLFCTVKALLLAPEMNAEFIGGEILRRDTVNLGFACDTERGLLVPVIRDCQTLAISELAARGKELAAQAMRGNISPDDLSGATFTVSNLGNLGIESFTPVLNPPQVGILGVDAIQLKPVRDSDGIAFIDSIGLSLTCDHQVIDGAPGARFLKIVRDQIENVEQLCTI